jgi:hypothetical protein
MIKIPYGESHFSRVIENNYFYIDRTDYINKIETQGSSYLFYLRPRRFGKSLFISMLHHYYALEHKENFQNLFGHLAIGKKPTPSANQYLVLKFEFSRINTNTAEATYAGFLKNVKDGVSVFLQQYSTFFTETQSEAILSETSPSEVIKTLFTIHIRNGIQHPIYILIDEYDHFANELISFNFSLFVLMVGRNGFVRKFYESIKTATGDGVVQRLFVTGVSPITLDSLTSGFNISTNLTLNKFFHQMLGFEEAEVKDLLIQIGVKKSALSTVIADLRAWYNGYLFHPDAKNRVYNPDMVLYFANEYQYSKQYPDRLLDVNIASDYGKIKLLFSIQDREKENLEVLNTLLEKDSITNILVAQFNFERPFTQADLVSLLFYMGFLTIERGDLGAFVFRFPNFVIQQLYADYFLTLVQKQNNLPIDNAPIDSSIRAMATTGNPQLFLDQVKLILKAHSTRDAQPFNEGSLKAIFISLLFQQQFYYVHSEFESEWQYVDVFLEAIGGYKPNYEVAFELKYLKKNSTDSVEDLLDKAELQLTRYMVSKKFYKRKSLKGFVVVVKGDDIFWREHKGFQLPVS